MSRWLQKFVYTINLNWLIFGVAALIVLLIACVTINFHAIKAATENPVKNANSIAIHTRF
jgi:putative ABC transport system permease protein